MKIFFKNNIKTIKSRIFFLFCTLLIITVVMNIFVFLAAIEWAESEIAIKRIAAYEKEAIEYFINNPEQDILYTDEKTVVYNNINKVPEEFRKYLSYYENRFEEVNLGTDGENYFINLSEYEYKGQRHQLIVIWPVYEIMHRMDSHILGPLAISLFVVFICIGVIMWHLYRTLFNPIITLKNQLDESKGNPKYQYKIAENSLSEFSDFTNQLNANNVQIDTLITREQAFARYASHELRTPLTSIIGSSTLLEKSEHSDFQERQITRIKNASKQMSSIVDLLLSLVRYEKNNAQVPVRQINKEEIETIISKYKEQDKSEFSKLKLSIEGTPRTVATPIVLDVVVGNLIKNALIAIKSNHTTPEISITLTDNGITVEDNGKGLVTEFIPYEKNQNNQENQHDYETNKLLPSHGFGLGLLIIHELCQRYSWDFMLENRTNSGCIARITFPPLDDSQAKNPLSQIND